MSDEQYKKLPSAMASATMLEAWVLGKVTLNQEQFELYVARVDRLLSYCEAKCRTLGWVDYEIEDTLPGWNEPHEDEA